MKSAPDEDIWKSQSRCKSIPEGGFLSSLIVRRAGVSLFFGWDAADLSRDTPAFQTLSF
jgi:hypothetical protein